MPVDFLVSRKTNVLVITGPNTGGKTIGLKTIGLASMMAKSGLAFLCMSCIIENSCCLSLFLRFHVLFG